MQVTDAMVRAASEAMKQRRRDEIERGRERATYEQMASLALTAAMAELWRPIEEAPKDGGYLVSNRKREVAFCDVRNGYRIVHNVPGHVEWDCAFLPTHFMPLPTPPREK